MIKRVYTLFSIFILFVSVGALSAPKASEAYWTNPVGNYYNGYSYTQAPYDYNNGYMNPSYYPTNYSATAYSYYPASQQQSYTRIPANYGYSPNGYTNVNTYNTYNIYYTYINNYPYGYNYGYNGMPNCSQYRC